MAATDHSQPEQPQPQGGTSALEWLAAAVSAVLVLGTIGTMLYEALSQPRTPPRIEVVADHVTRTDGGYVVAFTAYNRGRTTAAGLTVEGLLRDAEGDVERSSATLTYVPAEAHHRGWLVFTHDPARYRLTLRPVGYEQP